MRGGLSLPLNVRFWPLVMNIALIGNAILRAAIQQNLVSFPAQVPGFVRRQSADSQERIVQLYFVRGWPIRSICDRYRMSKATIQKILSDWRIRAVAAGYIQDIHPEDLDFLSGDLEMPRQTAKEDSELDFAQDGVAWPVPQPDHAVSAGGGL